MGRTFLRISVYNPYRQSTTATSSTESPTLPRAVVVRASGLIEVCWIDSIAYLESKLTLNLRVCELP